MNLSKFNDLDLEEKIVESNFNNDIQLLRKIFLENKLSDITTQDKVIVGSCDMLGKTVEKGGV